MSEGEVGGGWWKRRKEGREGERGDGRRWEGIERDRSDDVGKLGRWRLFLIARR